MKKTFICIFASIALSAMLPVYSAAPAQKVKVVVPKAPAVSASLRPYIAQYRQGNYIGAMQGIKTLLEKEPTNAYAKYYLALSYTQLGYQDEATQAYEEVMEESDNEALIYYSKQAHACLTEGRCKTSYKEESKPNSPASFDDIGKPSEGFEENPDDDSLFQEFPDDGRGDKPDKEKTAKDRELEDIDRFIRSGKQFHPSVTDKITKERMERQIQKEEYQRKLQEQERYRSDASMPTNEEIAAALNTLSRIGMNPYTQPNQFAMLNPYNNPANNYNMYANLLGNNNSNNMDQNMINMLLYSQMANRQNDFMNFGI